MKKLVATLGFLAAFASTEAYADCASPAGPAGRIDYFNSGGVNVFKYCDGTNWVPWAGEMISGIPAPSSSAGGSPDGGDGEVQFNLSGDFTASNNLLWDNTNSRLGINDNTPDVELDVVGDIHFTGVITDVSDIRVKKDILPLQNSLQKVSALNGFSFEMKYGPSHDREYGVSAQDVQAVFPELVHQVDRNGTLGVNYNGLIAPLIESIKELKNENEMLKARIEALERSNL